MELTLIGQIGVLSGQAEAREKGDCKKREFFEVVVSAKKLLGQLRILLCLSEPRTVRSCVKNRQV